MNTMISETFLPERSEWLEIFNTLGDIMFTLDCYGHVLLANEKALGFIEKEMHEIYGQGFEEFCVYFGIDPRLNFVSRALSMRTPAEEYCFSEGKNRWFKCTVYPPKTGPAPAVVRFVDVTAEYKHLKKIKLLSDVMENLREGALVLEAKSGNICYANRALCAMAGYASPEEFRGLPKTIFYADENPPELLKEISTASMESGWTGEVILKCGDGASIPAHFSTTPLRGVDGNVEHVVCVIRDITGEKSMQEQLLHAGKLSALSSLVSGVAHEINNPLSTIMGFSELALLRARNDPRLKDDLIEIQISAKRVHKIVKGFLSFSRRQTLQKDMLDVNALLSDMLSVIIYDFKINNIAVEMELSENAPSVYGDRQQLHQVFVNLLTNAKHAVEEAGGEKKVRVETIYEDGKVKVYVKDKGAGISEKIRARLFEPFFTTKEVGKGTGLGLSISHGIVTQHGGSLYIAEEEEGWSTVFCVELPADAVIEEDMPRTEDGAGEQVPCGNVHAEFSKKKVLVVDDEEQIRMMLCEWLVGLGCRVELAEDGEKAIEKIESAEYDCIICDMKMPNVTGEDVFLFLEQKFPRLLRRILFSTGDVVGMNTHAFLERKNCAYMEKPFEFSEFMEKVSVMLKDGASA